MNNILLGADANSRFFLERLKAHESAGEIVNNSGPLDGIVFSNDPEASVVGEYVSRPGEMLSLRMRPTTTVLPRWQALWISLGPLHMSAGGIFGVVVKSSAPSSVTTQICLRSGRANGFVDQPFSKTMVSFERPSTHLDVIDLDKAQSLPREAPWRDLILFFRPGNVEIDLLDVRVFMVWETLWLSTILPSSSQ